MANELSLDKWSSMMNASATTCPRIFGSIGETRRVRKSELLISVYSNIPDQIMFTIIKQIVNAKKL